MATIVLATAGKAIGGAIGGSFLGLTSTVIGGAIGATLGSQLDQRVVGQGSAIVETGKTDSFRLQTASEGTVVPRVIGQMRLPGQLIWSSHYKETVASSTSGGGKGLSRPKITTQDHTYSISLAFALGEGVLRKIGRIWADGKQIARDQLNITLHRGEEDQLPDPVISAVEGLENTPAYRGTAYVVIEDLQLAEFGNRIPQFNFEVFRPAQPDNPLLLDVTRDIQSVCLIPGTGEYSLATTPVHYEFGMGENKSANVNTNRGGTDLANAMQDLDSDLPECLSVSLVVSWFGSDLRCSSCEIMPKIEQTTVEGMPMPWKASGISRSAAETVSQIDNRPVFGGTPADAAVIEAITKIKNDGHSVVFYPFILMDIQKDNALPDPWSDSPNQPVMPWRGRITLAKAPGRLGTADQTTAAGDEVASFIGTAEASDFSGAGDTVTYSGTPEWSYRRFILHYAHLCALAGGVDSFCIGSEMRSLTQIRDGAASFPTVAAFKQLAQDVRSILGPDVKISYAADWSEYFGYQPQDGSGDVFFHLDPLWSDPAVDFIGIDNYMPLSDWRDGREHLDADFGSIYALDYLQSNVEGGEGYDWYYANAIDRASQNRSLISDGAYGEDWIFRYKDLRNWWDKAHHPRIGGLRQEQPTDWQPRSKPIIFTEFGCPAIDKGTNQPNVFVDPKSSESHEPYFSNGSGDTQIQSRYFKAIYDYWGTEGRNPVSTLYNGPMIDLPACSAWAWDARPYPDFPDRLNVWSDGGNYATGHWLTGRFGAQDLAAVVAEICEASGFFDYDVSKLTGSASGVLIKHLESARQSLQPLMIAYGFTSFERDGTLVFANHSEDVVLTLDESRLAITAEKAPAVTKTRSPNSEMPGRLQVNYWNGADDYQAAAAVAALYNDNISATATIDLPLVLSRSEAQNAVNRRMIEAQIARDALQFSLPPSVSEITPGDLVRLPGQGHDATYRVDRIEEFGQRQVEAMRVERFIYDQKYQTENPSIPPIVAPPLPVHAVFLDLPLLPNSKEAFSPYVGAVANPWPGGVAVYSSASNEGYSLNALLPNPATYGVLASGLASARAARWDNGVGVFLRLAQGNLQSRPRLEVLNGGNAAALRFGGIGDWEVFQFQNAELQEDGSYHLSTLLRGQLGTEPFIPGIWPEGTEFVLLDQNISQIDLPELARGLERHFRIGPASYDVAHASFSHHAESFPGVGLRPYSPVHLQLSTTENGDIIASWLRRSRIDGDSWQSVDVPLGEAAETYHLRIMQSGVQLREETVQAPVWVYTAQAQTTDGLGGGAIFEVAQISEKFGVGPYEGIAINV